MHVLFEGIGELLCRLLLKELCLPQTLESEESHPGTSSTKKKSRKKALLPLKLLNQFLQEECDYGHLSVSKPSPIEISHLKKKLKQSASQMIVLLHVMPFIVYSRLPQERLDLLLEFQDVVNLTTMFEMEEARVVSMETAIEIFGENFARQYPKHLTLKLHALRHLGMQVRFHGVLRSQWCFRFEAMHRQFTRLVDVINSMKNIEFSLVG